MYTYINSLHHRFLDFNKYSKQQTLTGDEVTANKANTKTLQVFFAFAYDYETR